MVQNGGLGTCVGYLRQGIDLATLNTCSFSAVNPIYLRCIAFSDNTALITTNFLYGTPTAGTGCALTCNEHRGFFLSPTATQPICIEQAGHLAPTLTQVRPPPSCVPPLGPT